MAIEPRQAAFAVETKTILVGFCQTARDHGSDEAQRVATTHLVAAAAYLKDIVGAVRAKEILLAAVASVSPDLGIN